MRSDRFQRIGTSTRVVVNGLLAVILAPLCAACRSALDSPLDGPVCDACWRSVAGFAPPLCDRCGEPLPSWRTISVETGRCPRCRRRETVVSRSGAVGDYAGALRAIIHALKYDGRRSVATPLGALLAGECAPLLVRADALVPVPLHWRRQRARGYNQAVEIARALAQPTGLPLCDALRRVRSTPSQIDLPAARRHANVRAAFALRRGIVVDGLRLVLVDDVRTTGATIEACAATLIAAGAVEVRAVTVARVGCRAPPGPPR